MGFLLTSEAVSYAWIVLVVFWFVSAWRVKRTAEAEPRAARLVHIVTMVLAYLLLFDLNLRLGVLNQRFLPISPAATATGVLFTWAGIAFAIWARVHIGQYWSARVTLKEDHKLISTGPYKYVRHPIYTGLLAATVGTAFAIGRWQGLIGATIILFAHILKARKEERLMTSHFGAAYEDYRLHTGFLIPRFY
jgi:protein-S-isoprenylcysteine O-methyltransferase Ste14